jgi:hypothetical protein
MAILWDVLRQYQFHREPLFAALKPVDPDADRLLQACRASNRVLEPDDQLWLNRYLLDAAGRQATGQRCFRRLSNGLDGVLVSDVGKPFQVQGDRRAGGIIRTAMRATDIVMDRVWQLEIDTFQHMPGFVFAPITEVVELAEDPTAIHPELQRQLPTIRTDLDRFSLLEISSLVRHGYCVARKTCRACPELFGSDMPANPPWDPVPAQRGAAPPVSALTRLDRVSREPAATTVEARTLHTSSIRRIWSTLLDRRDWTSYVYVPILIPILLLMPYLVVRFYQHSRMVNHLINTISQGSGDFEQMKHLLDDGPEKPWTGVAAEEVRELEKTDLKGFVILQDSLILDLRNWNPNVSGKDDPRSVVQGYRRLKVLKEPDHSGDNVFRFRLLPTSPKAEVRFPRQELAPTVLKSRNVETSVPGRKECVWQMNCDFQRVPPGESVDLRVDFQSPGQNVQSGEQSTMIAYEIQAETSELTAWILMPKGKEYRSFRVTKHETAKPEKVERVKLVTEYLADDYTILAFKLLSLKPRYTYEVSWIYK